MNHLAGKRILITSGPTRGRIDAIRYISNTSSGKLGVLLAGEALSRGASVTFVRGKDSLAPDAELVGEDGMARLRVREIETVDELLGVMREELRDHRYHAVLHAMAVLDYTPEAYLDQKTPSGQSEWWIKLVPTPKVIKEIKELQPASLLIGFKLEAGKSDAELIETAHRSLLANRADLVLANRLEDLLQGRHTGYLVDPTGGVVAVAEGKQEIARMLLDAVSERVNSATA